MNVRIADRLPSLSEFGAHVAPERGPVLFRTGLESWPISALNSSAKLRDALGHVEVFANEEYFSAFRRTRNLFAIERKQTSLAGFLDLIETSAGARLVVTEHFPPGEVAALVNIPDLCRYALGEDGSSTIQAEMFIAGSGTCAHLHFDWDFRHVLLCQIFGTKDFVVLPPRSARLVQPLFNTGLLCLESMTSAEREGFALYAGGWYGSLHPGEALYMPPCVWHWLSYIDVAMSVGLRFGRPTFARAFQSKIHPNAYLQNICWELLRPTPLTDRDMRVVKMILEGVVSAPVDPAARWSHMESLCRERCQEYTGLTDEVWFRDETLLANQVRAGIQAGALYPSR